MKKTFEFLTTIGLIVGALTCFSFAAAFTAVLIYWPIGTYVCSQEAESFEHRYLVIPVKCQVLINGKWINFQDNARAIVAEKQEEP